MPVPTPAFHSTDMRKRFLVSVLIIALIGLISGVVIYLNTPAATVVPVLAVPRVGKPTEAVEAREGTMKTVVTPPQTFNGRLSPEATSIEEFSSNPKRDPEEQQVLDIAGARGVADQAKVQRLLVMIPTLPPDAQTLAMEHATALIPDEDYLKYRQQLLSLAKTQDMRVAVMDDSLTRGEEVRLPNLLEMMRTSTSEEEKQEIREIFEAYLDKDYGPHPSQWEIPIRNWVAENSDS